MKRILAILRRMRVDPELGLLGVMLLLLTGAAALIWAVTGVEAAYGLVSGFLLGALSVMVASHIGDKIDD